MAASPQTKAAALEGLDFIETEEDVKAVEAATLKIQSTFRGRKIRSKVGGNGAGGGAPAEKRQEPAKAEAQSAQANCDEQVNKSVGQQEQQSDKQTKQTSSRPQSHALQDQEATNELSKRVSNMQVQDNSGQPPQLPGELTEEEAERAATKIQAGFKGYKTRKELEEGGKLPASSAAGRQAAPGNSK